MKDNILSAHGSGGKLMNDMIETIIKSTLGPESIQLDDSAIINIGDKKIAFTTDSYTISPIFFPGGDIGSLAVNGTVNDLSVMGAVPMYISCSLILEEGFPVSELKSILSSMKRAADIANVSIVTGDTKVVQKGNADKIFINTSGIGLINNAVQRREIIIGDRVIINGSIGDHGIAVISKRNNLTFSKGLASDCAPLNHMIQRVIQNHPADIKFMRDPTRGGVASVLNELVKGKKFSIMLHENQLPIKEEVMGVCNLLGLDPLYAANEGKVLIISEKKSAEDIVTIMRETREGKDACIIGEITEEYPGKVFMETIIGGSRILPLLIDEQLPRIC